MSLRDQKKAMTRDAILDAAEELFGVHGYTHTTIEQIAEKAMVAVGTVYNYVASKSRLLVAINERDTAALIERGSLALEVLPADPEAACSDLLRLYMLSMLGKYDRELMREIWAAAISGSPTLTRELLRLDRMLIEQLADLLRRYQQQGTIDPSLPVETGAGLLYGTGAALMMTYLADDDVTPEAVGEGIDEMIALTFRDWRRRGTSERDDLAAMALLTAEVLRFMDELDARLSATAES